MSTTKLKCQNANHICDKAQYREASFWEKIKLNLHLLYCKACRSYSSNNSKLTNIINDNNVTCMDMASKAKIEDALNKELANKKQ